jgi:hypothetical protein
VILAVFPLVIHLQISHVSSRQNSSQILRRLGRASDDDFGGERRPSHGEDRTVLDVGKALAALDPSGFGLADICAQLGSSTYVMADEARPHFLR